MVNQFPRRGYKVTILAWDLSHNALGRAYMLAEVLAPYYEVSIVGPIFEEIGKSVWKPLEDSPIPIEVFPGKHYPEFLDQLEAALPLVDGDIIIACKSRMPSLQLALMAKATYNRPLILDIDDYELDLFNKELPLEENDLQIPYGEAWTYFAESLIKYADHIIVSNHTLQKKYGGTIIPHARDANVFNPSLYNKDKRRLELGIPVEDKIILFLGTPRRHKGLRKLLKVIKNSDCPSWKLCIIGSFPKEGFKEKLLSDGDENLILIPDQPFSEIAKNLIIADAICLLQDQERKISNYQFPAKVVDAIAMGIPVMASHTLPLKPLIDRGLIIPTSIDTLSEDLSKVLTYTEALKQKQKDQRNFFLKVHSYQALRQKLIAIIDNSLDKHEPLPKNVLDFDLLQKSFLNIIDCLIQPLHERNKQLSEKSIKLEEELYKVRRKNIKLKMRHEAVKKSRIWQIKLLLNKLLSIVKSNRSKRASSSHLLTKNVNDNQTMNNKKVTEQPEPHPAFNNSLTPEKTKKKAIKKIRAHEYRLYHLGFKERAISDLQLLSEDACQPFRKSLAARVLAIWHVNQCSKEHAQLSLEKLNIIELAEHEPDLAIEIAVLKAECVELLGDPQSAKLSIWQAIESYGPSVDLYLAMANLESTSDTRVKWINKALSFQGLSEIDLQTYKNASNIRKFNFGKQKLEHFDLHKFKVTVIVTIEDDSEAFHSTLISILGQSIRNLEIFLVGNINSSNLLLDLYDFEKKDNRIKLIKSGLNEGSYAARNYALKEATGQFVICCETGTCFHPDMIKLKLAYLINNPGKIAAYSHQVFLKNNFKINRLYNKGSYLAEDHTSIMFRKEPVVNSIGYWDDVKFVADLEFIQRIKKVFGNDALQKISEGPLSFIFKENTFLNFIDVCSNTQNYIMMLQKEYMESYNFFHENTDNYYYEFPQKQRPFAVPALILSAEKTTSFERRHFDILLISDFRLEGGSSISSMEEIKAQKKMGLSTGLFQMPRYSVDPFKPVDNRIRRLVDGDLVQMLVYGEKVSCDLLIIRYPPILQEPQEYVLDIEASKLCVIVNQTPKRDYGEEGQFVYDIKNCVNNLNNYFDQTGVWYPIGPLVRNTLMNYHADELSIIKFADKNWSNIIDIDEWKRQSRPKRRSKIRIGRHSRDQYVKWPSDPDTISYIYPDSSEYEVHLLGGAQVPIELLGYKPANWLVLEFGEIDPKDFLEQLDVFVYYTHPDWVESFGRVILEAMAVGVPVILPHVYRELFKESAIYAKPDEVQKAINKLMDDDSYYEAQVRKAYNFVKNNFGYDAHENRLKELLKK